MRSQGDKDFYCSPQSYDTVQSGSCIDANVPAQNAAPNFRVSFPTLSDYLRTYVPPNPGIILTPFMKTVLKSIDMLIFLSKLHV